MARVGARKCAGESPVQLGAGNQELRLLLPLASDLQVLPFGWDRLPMEPTGQPTQIERHLENLTNPKASTDFEMFVIAGVSGDPLHCTV